MILVHVEVAKNTKNVVANRRYMHKKGEERAYYS